MTNIGYTGNKEEGGGRERERKKGREKEERDKGRNGWEREGGGEGREKKLIKQINIWHMNIHSFFHNLNDVNELTRISLFCLTH